LTFQAKLEQSASKRLCVRLSEIRPQRSHSSGQNDIPSCQGVWQREDPLFNGVAVVADRVLHAGYVTKMLPESKRKRRFLVGRAGNLDHLGEFSAFDLNGCLCLGSRRTGFMTHAVQCALVERVFPF
jgi:hypothetical protein